MKARNVKRIVALGTGLSMVGATLFGASAAADLADYPSPLFIKDGQFDGMIVVGDDAVSSDVIGAIDIATALQAESVIEDSAPIGSGLYSGGVGRVSVSGDVAEMSRPNDMLELQEFLGDVRSTLTELDMNMLRGGIITTNEGTTDYNQYLRFEETSGTNSFNSTLRVVYQEDEDDNVGDFLYSPDSSDAYLFEFEIEFEQGAESSIESNTELDDLEDEIFNMLGTPFAIADTEIDTAANSVTIDLLAGAISDILEEGETKTYTIDGKEYEVNVLIVADTREIVKFKINGEITDALSDGETDVLKDGTRIGIREILPNEAEEVTGGDLVEFYLGATKLEFRDSEYNESATSFDDGNVEVNDESIEDGYVQISGRDYSNGKFEILSIKYRLIADTLIGDLYVPPGHGVREYLDEPEGMLSPNWDIVYGGLMDTGVSILKFDASGDDEYDVRFTTQEGLNYNVQLVDNDRSTLFRVGDDDQKLIWIEADNSAVYNIAQDDQFILTDSNDETGFTHIIEYQSFDSGDQQLSFTDLAGETREFTADGTVGVDASASLIFGGNTYTAYVGAAPDYNLSVDLNNDGTIGDGIIGGGDDGTNDGCTSQIRGLSINATGHSVDVSSTARTNLTGPCRSTIVIQGGGILDLGVCDGNKQPMTTSCPAYAPGGAFDGSGTNAFQIGLLTVNSRFDEDGPRNQGGDELVLIKFENRSGFETGLSVVEGSGTYTVGESRFALSLQELKENNDIERDMTDYGVLVELYDADGSNDAEDLTIEYPLVQRGAHVFIVSGEYGITKSGAGSVSQTVQRISVGAAKLASEVEDVMAVNAVVVGGPCANAAAADLLGNPADCAAGFEPGKAMIKLFENGDNVALLVAGAEALDTRRAARVLANHADYDLSGDEITVTGTSLTDISVQSVA